MLITCCTDTYFKWAELFLRSFKVTNGTSIPIHINGMRLTDDQMDAMHGWYPNLTIKNRTYKEGEVAERYGVTIDDVRRCSEAISRGFKKDCRWWMDFIVVDGRIAWLYDTIVENPKPWWLHIDIDLMFRKSIQPLVNQILSHDVVCRFRPDRTFYKPKKNREVTDDMKIAGGMVGLRGENGRHFVKKWLEQIQSKTYHDFNPENGLLGRGRQGWGQTTLYYAYRHFEDKFTWDQIDAHWLLAGCNLNNPIWAGHRKGGVVSYRGTNYPIPDRTALREVFFKELILMESEHGTS